MMLLHAGAPPAPHDAIFAWTADPWIFAPLTIAGAMYLRGARIASSRSTNSVALLGRRGRYFAAGWVLLALALVSPLHAVGEVLFSAHMIQHEVLMTIVAPLLVLGRPPVPMLWSLSESGRAAVARLWHSTGMKRIWREASAPLTAWLIHGLTIWIWHVPVLYDASVSSRVAHTAQHASFLGTALLFWWAMFSMRGRERAGLACVLLFTTAIHTSLLGVLLMVSELPLYGAYNPQAIARWGLTPLEDQQLGGIIMWVPGSLTYMLAALVLFLRWTRISSFPQWPAPPTRT